MVLVVPKYRFTAATIDGTVTTGVETSTGMADKRDALLNRNLQPISILEKKCLLQFEITPKKVSKRRAGCTPSPAAGRVLALWRLPQAPMAFSILAEETSNKVLRSALEGMRTSLESGARFSEAAADHSELFPPYAVEILRSAGLSGNLDARGA